MQQATRPSENSRRTGRRRSASEGTRFFKRRLEFYRDTTIQSLVEAIPKTNLPFLYDLVSLYPLRPGKGLRSALCLAACSALGGSTKRALGSAVATELFHNAFLIHDDVQDGSESRRGAPTLHRQYGAPIAINVGNATNLLGLQRLMENRNTLGQRLSWKVFRETERMMRHSLEGQALELSWIRRNVGSLSVKDYLHMCLKKTSWYSFIYPMRIGAMIALDGHLDDDEFCRFGRYIGAAFQIRDDILNLTGDYRKYGKEIFGDLFEGKRTLMLIHLLKHCSSKDRRSLKQFLARPREERKLSQVEWVHRAMLRCGSIKFAHTAERQLAGAALLEGLTALRDVPDSDDKRFILEMVLFVTNRAR